MPFVVAGTGPGVAWAIHQMELSGCLGRQQQLRAQQSSDRLAVEAVRYRLGKLKLRKYSRNPAMDVALRESLRRLESVHGADLIGWRPSLMFLNKDQIGATITVRKPQRYLMDSQLQSQNSQRTLSTTPEAACQSGTAAGSSCGAMVGGDYKSANRPSVRVSLDVEANSSFSEALRHVINGGHAARAGWNGPGQYVFAQYPDKGSKMTAPYLILRDSQGGFLPWAPSQGDVFARDWALLPGRTHDVS